MSHKLIESVTNSFNSNTLSLDIRYNASVLHTNKFVTYSMHLWLIRWVHDSFFSLDVAQVWCTWISSWRIQFVTYSMRLWLIQFQSTFIRCGASVMHMNKFVTYSMHLWLIQLQRPLIRRSASVLHISSWHIQCVCDLDVAQVCCTWISSWRIQCVCVSFHESVTHFPVSESKTLWIRHDHSPVPRTCATSDENLWF